jgi:DNA-binding MarR family transcriptional regulator
MKQARQHPVRRLDDVVHQRVRLGVLALLVQGGRCEFRFLRDELGLTDGNLSRHLTVLAGAGLVSLDKLVDRTAGQRARTWVSATARGRKAFRAEIAALRDLLDGVGDA